MRGLVRSPERAAGRGLPPELALYRGELPDGCDATAFAGADVVVHCAWDVRPRSRRAAARVNHDGSLEVRRRAREAGARFVFLSSLAARPGTDSVYGRGKLAVEAALDPATDLAVRPGLVLGPLDPAAGGLFFRLADALRRFRVVPLVAGGRGVLQSVHLDDLAAAVDAALTRGVTGTVTIADPLGIEVREFFRRLAAGLGVRHLGLPVPLRPTLGVLRTLERLRLPLPIGSDTLVGQAELERVDCRADLDRLGVEVRGAEVALAAALAPASG